jgi:hypothetical protein
MVTLSKRVWIIVATVLAIGVMGGAGAGIAFAVGGAGDQPLTGSVLTKCTAAALAANPGGTVTETEIGDDGAAYSVEIQLSDGSEVEVNLDESCQVIGQEPDNDDDSGDDDSNDDGSSDDGSSDD